MVVLGRPAAYARRLQRRALVRSAVSIVVAALGAAVVLGVPGEFPTVRLNVTGAVAVTVTVTALLARERFAVAARKAGVGITSEKRVAQALSRIDGLEAVVHGALIGAGGDADHIALGPVCVVIETKTGKGAVSQDRSGALRVGRRTIPGDPVAQVARQAQALQRHVGYQVTPLVCIPDATGEPRQMRGVWVCNTRQLAALVVAAPRVMRPGEAPAVARDLHRRSVAEQAARDARTG